MRNLRHHAPEHRRIRPHDRATHGLQPQRPDDRLVLLRTADGAAYQLNLDHCLSHFQNRFWFLVSRFLIHSRALNPREPEPETRNRLTSPYPKPTRASPPPAPCRATVRVR